ncbi:ATP-binding cassette domain-containing protein [Algoriphagus halophytocola]|uniref:ATP-binding cassette domain-containing protein n=1 Tax=Algoriphagus halophytocola TaxID=2991499 RepID=A0ABY6MCE1_9BACT|nr:MULTISPECIES: ATP-binding cassette domain-containing protein [unclassified Algoriphagus]UZD20944.1 ATP-binding cassette domain-containing protein [Algoriphagus sp. TR-M5]WBL42110.1 ATP-binding cassette domain-containing protein [Algoriphagus sp. TR-M9]
MLKINKLNKSYGANTALTDVDLEVSQGVIFGLLGPNGAGKTTLIRIINQIIDSDSGEVFIGGEKLEPKHIKQIGYLPEERGLYKKMKVWDQMLYFARLKGLSPQEAKSKINYWLDKLDMQSWRDKKIEDLSKGMAQKVQFISTIVHNPPLLILDEPFSGFDPVNADIIKNEILELKENGTTVILSTHRMESVELLCDQVAMINRSRKIIDGTIKELKSKYRPEVYSISLEHLKKELPAEWISKEEDGSHHFTLPLSGKSPNELIQELMQYGQVNNFQELIPSMEEIFIHQVKSTENG